MAEKIFDTKVIFSGLEGNGKTLRLAMQAEDLLERNSKWYEETGIQRPIAPNFKLSSGFERRAEQANVPIVYWRHLHELIKIQQADVLIDEVGNYFDSRLWSDLSLDVRQWLTQGDKSGIELYGTAQDFGQVDKSFRRLVTQLLHITKAMGSPRPSATKPPVKVKEFAGFEWSVWGLCWIFALDPRTYDESDDKFAKLSIFDWRFFFIRKRYTEIFDTSQKIPRSEPAPLRHEVRFCEHYHEKDSECKHFKVSHI